MRPLRCRRHGSIVAVTTHDCRDACVDRSLIAKSGGVLRSAASATTAQVSYRNAERMSWDGQGEMPDWLRRAVNAGQSVEFFRVG